MGVERGFETPKGFKHDIQAHLVGAMRVGQIAGAVDLLRLELSEQFDRLTGVQISAKQLAWSYAAFITAAASRRRAYEAIRG